MSPTDTAVKNIGELQKLAVDAPTIFFALIAIIVPLALLAGLALVIKYWLLPAWRDEKLADREQKAADNAEFRKLIDEQHGRIVERIEGQIRQHSGEIDKLHGKIDRQSEALGRIAAKLAVPAILCLVYLGGLFSGFGIFVAVQRRHLQQIETAANCPNGCGSLDCCGEGKCCERKKDTAKSPSSATAMVKLDFYAGPNYCPRSFRTNCY